MFAMHKIMWKTCNLQVLIQKCVCSMLRIAHDENPCVFGDNLLVVLPEPLKTQENKCDGKPGEAPEIPQNLRPSLSGLFGMHATALILALVPSDNSFNSRTTATWAFNENILQIHSSVCCEY